MQVAVEAPQGWKRRAAPLLGGFALAGAATVVALNDPAAPGSHFPACLFHATTGLWCPGCGLTRGFHQLFNGHVGAAVSANVFVPVVLVAVVLGWVGWTLSAFGRPMHRRVSLVGTRWVTVVLPVALVVYGVLRNVPAQPFAALAP